MSEKTKSRLSLAISAAFLAGSVFAAVWAAASDRSAVVGDCKALKATATDHEIRLRQVESLVGRMAQDVGWIREYLARHEPAAPVLMPPGRQMPPDRLEAADP